MKKKIIKTLIIKTTIKIHTIPKIMNLIITKITKKIIISIIIIPIIIPTIIIPIIIRKIPITIPMRIIIITIKATQPRLLVMVVVVYTAKIVN